jgi:beta-glucosidase
MSFTSFGYSNLQISNSNGGNVTVTIDVTNSGAVAGAEVPQLYMGFPDAAGEPPKQLRGFDKIQLRPGEKKTATFTLTSLDRSIWDVTAHAWKEQAGNFGVFVGASLCDLRMNGTFAA